MFVFVCLFCFLFFLFVLFVVVFFFFFFFFFFSECLKDRTLRKYNFVNSFNVKTEFKRYKVLQGPTCVWKLHNIQQEFVLHAFKSDDE